MAKSEVINQKNDQIELLCIGHCCHDKVDDGYILGGTVSYASMIAKKLGANAAVLTSVGTDFLFKQEFVEKDIPFHSIEAAHTTVFENIYQGRERIQYMHERAGDIGKNEVPGEFKDPDVVLIGPIAKEIDFDVLSCFKSSIIGATIQGFIRRWDNDGLVHADQMDWSLLRSVDVVIMSDDDLKGMEGSLVDIRSYVGHIVMTLGSRGVKIYIGDQEYFFPSFPTEIIDVTGAGDAFTTAYLLEYNRTKNITLATIYAHATASYVIGGIGIGNLPTDEDVRERVEKYREKFL